MTNPYELIKQGRPNNDVIHAAAMLSKFELSKIAAEVADNDIYIIGDYVCDNCQKSGVQKTLIFGCLLELFASASREEQNPDILAEMYERLGIKRSYAFECRAVWRCFGSPLTKQPNVAARFLAASLKILSQESTPEAARAEAVERAAKGELINIAVAKAIRQKHAAPKPKPEKEMSPQPVKPNKIVEIAKKLSGVVKVYTGRLIQVTLKPTAAGDADNIDALIRDLEDAITQLRQRRIQEARSREAAARGTHCV